MRKKSTLFRWICSLLLLLMHQHNAMAVNAACPYGTDQCKRGYVWREAFQGDHACVTGTVRNQTLADNLLAAARRVPPGSPNPESCLHGFVWREASAADHVCVSGSERSQAASDNAQSASRRDPACSREPQSTELPPTSSPNRCPFGEDQCKTGFVWREAGPNDRVCVEGSAHSQAKADNAQAAQRRVPSGSANPDECLPGYVWREAFQNDRVCVSGTVRSQAAAENGQAPSRRDAACANTVPTMPPTRSGTSVPPVVTGPPGPTSTLSGYKTLYGGTTTIADLTEGTATAQCPTGKVVVGGYSLGGGGGQTTQSYPLPDGTGYVSAVAAGIFSGSAGDPLSLSTLAICIDRPAGYEVVQATRHLASRERGSVEARCPAGKLLLGGGAKGARQVYLASNSPNADGTTWTALFRSLWIIPSNEAVQAFAVCASAPAVVGRKLISTPNTLIGPGGGTQQKFDCAPQKPLSAGWSSDGTLVGSSWLSLITPDTVLSRPRPMYLGSGAIGNGSSIFDNVSLNVSLRAICANVP